jgi:hypothetical protein
VRVGRREVEVGTGTVPVVLGMVQPPGKRAMPAADWARGSRLEPVSGSAPSRSSRPPQRLLRAQRRAGDATGCSGGLVTGDRRPGQRARSAEPEHRSAQKPSQRSRRADPARQAAYETLRAVALKDAYANLVLPDPAARAADRRT